jgi:transcriptional regulator with XRE-family HTH domain
VNADFPRIISLLRKEKKISQKTAAKDLGVSQALLSHYEKGIRECGLDFVAKAARYYGVSADYLLGISPNRDGLIISVDEIPETDPNNKENIVRGSLLPVLNKKLIVNSLNIIFSMLQKCENKAVADEVASFLMLSVYSCFRTLYAMNENNSDKFFTLPDGLAQSAAIASMMMSEAKLQNHIGNFKLLNPDCFSITTEEIADEYPLFASSLSNLIKECEKRLSE